MSTRVAVIGVAPGATTLDERALGLIARAELLVSARRHLPLARGFDGEVMEVEGKVSEAVSRVAEEKNLRTVFLASGDPGFFGIATLVSRKLAPEEIRVLPAVTSMQEAFAKAGLSWSQARFMSLHGRPFEGLAKVLGAPRVALLTDGENTPAKVANFLLDAGWDKLKMVVASDLGMKTERIDRGAVSDFAHWSGSTMNVVLLANDAPDERPLGPGLPEKLFAHPRGRITKREVRAAALGALALPREGVLWDVGAGSGSVGIEAALLCPALSVYAVEREEEAFCHVVDNRRRFKAANLVAVEGAAPGSLSGLPTPDRVFIGGSGGALGEVLDLIAEVLTPGGRVVLSTVLRETFDAALAWADGAGWKSEWVEISVSRPKTVGSGTMRVSQTPVTLITLEQNGEGI